MSVIYSQVRGAIECKHNVSIIKCIDIMKISRRRNHEPIHQHDRGSQKTKQEIFAFLDQLSQRGEVPPNAFWDILWKLSLNLNHFDGFSSQDWLVVRAGLEISLLYTLIMKLYHPSGLIMSSPGHHLALNESETSHHLARISHPLFTVIGWDSADWLWEDGRSRLSGNLKNKRARSPLQWPLRCDNIISEDSIDINSEGYRHNDTLIPY